MRFLDLVSVGTWTEWIEWSDCSVTCDSGTRTRTRTCEGPGACDGQDNETEDCNLTDCSKQKSFYTFYKTMPAKPFRKV